MKIVKNSDNEKLKNTIDKDNTVRVYTKKCKHCGCVFEYNENEAKHESWDWEAIEFRHINCPSCGHSLRHHGLFGKRRKVIVQPNPESTLENKVVPEIKVKQEPAVKEIETKEESKHSYKNQFINGKE